MNWKPKPEKWDWRKFLTSDEAAIVRASDDDAAAIERLRADYRKRWALRRQLIVNRAIQRAKYASTAT